MGDQRLFSSVWNHDDLPRGQVGVVRVAHGLSEGPCPKADERVPAVARSSRFGTRRVRQVAMSGEHHAQQSRRLSLIRVRNSGLRLGSREGALAVVWFADKARRAG